MNNPGRKRQFNKSILFPVIGIGLLLAMIGVVVSGFWYQRQCSIIYDEVNASVVKSGMKIYAEYDGQKVEISRPNINYVINAITDRLVSFTSEDKTPEEEPVILAFGEELLMEIYPAEDYNVFVRHTADDKTKHYIIKGTCNFNNLKKMVSLDQWSYPNILVENK